MSMTIANKVIAECRELQEMYKERDKGFRDAFKLLDNVDENARADMQSFVSNDPRSFWNMATFLLMPRPLVIRIMRIDEAPLAPLEELAAVTVERLFARQWAMRNKVYRQRGGQSWQRAFIGTMTMTGWYAVPHGLKGGEFFVDFWNPIQVYPDFATGDTDGLVRVARVRKLSRANAMRRATREGWDVSAFKTDAKGSIAEYQLWKIVDGMLQQQIVFQNTLVDNRVLSLNEIPLLVGGTGGLPSSTLDDELGMITVNAWEKTGSQRRIGNSKAILGQSIFATNERVYAQLNKQMSFLQQLLHDTANPKTIEKTSGNRKILTNPNDFFKRGAHFKLDVNDSLEVLSTPGIPAEAQTLAFQLRNMIQRGSFSDVTFGNVVGDISAVVMSQAAESAQQVIEPYHDSTQYVFETVTQGWYDAAIRTPDSIDGLTSVEVEALKLLRDVSADMIVNAQYTIKIPGDLAQRATLASRLNPDFKLSNEQTLEMFFPEITDARREMSARRKDDAHKHPVYVAIDLIQSLRDAARAVEVANPDLAKLYTAAAAKIAAELDPSPQGQQLPGTQVPSGAQPRGLPAAPPILGPSPNGAVQ